MRKTHALGLAVIVMFAFGAITASAAFAEAEWLIDLSPVAELKSVESTGLLLLIDLKTAVGIAKVHCEGILDGSVGPKGEDEITEVLNSTGVSIKLGGTALLCEGEEGCIKNATDTEVWPENLPWTTQLSLVEPSGVILDLLGKKPGYTVLCLVLGGLASAEDECINENSGSATLENMAAESDVLAIFAEENTAHCTQSGENSGDITGEGLIFALEGLTLEVSETGEE